MQLSTNTKIGVAVGGLALALGIIYFTTFRGDGTSSGEVKDITVMCTKCKASYDLSQEKLAQLMQSGGGMNPMMMMATGPFACDNCKQKAAYIANKCIKCKNVFFPDNRVQYSDKCPKCGFSEMEQIQKSVK